VVDMEAEVVIEVACAMRKWRLRCAQPQSPACPSVDVNVGKFQGGEGARPANIRPQCLSSSISFKVNNQ
jgi:hypothetical protein